MLLVDGQAGQWVAITAPRSRVHITISTTLSSFHLNPHPVHVPWLLRPLWVRQLPTGQSLAPSPSPVLSLPC